MLQAVSMSEAGDTWHRSDQLRPDQLLSPDNKLQFPEQESVMSCNQNDACPICFFCFYQLPL